MSLRGLAGSWVLVSCAGSSSAAAPAPAGAERVMDDACVVSGPEVCFNARDDNCNGPIDEGCGLEGGLIQFAIAWDQEAADVDLEVTDPKGHVAELGQPTSSGLVKDRDCPGKDNSCRGANIENVRLSAGKKPLRGRYVVVVRLESWSRVDTPVAVNLGTRLGPRSFSSTLEFEREKEEQRFEFEL